MIYHSEGTRFHASNIFQTRVTLSIRVPAAQNRCALYLTPPLPRATLSSWLV